MSDNGVKKSASTIVVSLALAGIVGISTSVISLMVWKPSVDAQLAAEQVVAATVQTNNSVLAQHGEEFALLRSQVDSLRGEISATRREVIDAIAMSSNDRFRGQDWEREKATINLRFKRIEDQIENLTSEVGRAVRLIERIEESK